MQQPQSENSKRADRAREAVAHYDAPEGLGSRLGTRIFDDETAQVEVLSDLLCDLRHLCDALSIDHGEVDSRGHRNYLADLAEARVS